MKMADKAVLPFLILTVIVTLKGAQFREEAKLYLDHKQHKPSK